MAKSKEEKLAAEARALRAGEELLAEEQQQQAHAAAKKAKKQKQKSRKQQQKVNEQAQNALKPINQQQKQQQRQQLPSVLQAAAFSPTSCCLQSYKLLHLLLQGNRQLQQGCFGALSPRYAMNLLASAQPMTFHLFATAAHGSTAICLLFCM